MTLAPFALASLTLFALTSAPELREKMRLFRTRGDLAHRQDRAVRDIRR